MGILILWIIEHIIKLFYFEKLKKKKLWSIFLHLNDVCDQQRTQQKHKQSIKTSQFYWKRKKKIKLTMKNDRFLLLKMQNSIFK